MEFTKPFRTAKITYSNLSLSPEHRIEFFKQKPDELPEAKLASIKFLKSDTSLDRKRKLDILKSFNEILDEDDNEESPLTPMTTGKNHNPPETSPNNKKNKRGRPRKKSTVEDERSRMKLKPFASRPSSVVSHNVSPTEVEQHEHEPKGGFQFANKLSLGLRNVFGEYPKNKNQSHKKPETICNFDMPVQIIDDIHGINSEFPLQYIDDNPKWLNESADEILVEKRNRWMYWRLRDDTNANHKGKVRRFDRILEGIYYDLYYNENQTLEGEPMANLEPIN